MVFAWIKNKNTGWIPFATLKFHDIFTYTSNFLTKFKYHFISRIEYTMLKHYEFLEYWNTQKVFGGFHNIFHVYLMRGFQKFGRNWILMVAFWEQTKAGQKCAARCGCAILQVSQKGKKPSWEFNFFHIFGILSSSRYEKWCQILHTLFWVLQYFRNSQWLV